MRIAVSIVVLNIHNPGYCPDFLFIGRYEKTEDTKKQKSPDVSKVSRVLLSFDDVGEPISVTLPVTHPVIFIEPFASFALGLQR
ncbi:hypothetical protein HBIMPC_26115 [Chitinophaga sp. 212800010-3]|nr:hypothetical protein [Chitinophaga sp. 212800010-3]